MAHHKTPTRALTRTPVTGDRYLPNRASTDMNYARFKTRTHDTTTPLQESLLQLTGQSSGKALQFSSPIKRTPNYWETPKRKSVKKVKQRKIPKTADRVLDAPNILNDFYLNVLDYSQTGVLAVALRETVYLLNTGTGAIDQISLPSEQDYVASLAWTKNSDYLSLGTSGGELQLWDVSASKMVRLVGTGGSRVGSLAWNTRSSVLSSGRQSGVLEQHDLRVAQATLASVKAHSMDVCGLTWSGNGQLLASGGNDNLVCIWDMYGRDPWTEPAQILKQHTAAVKAISWCPWQSSLLATGGGSADKSLCLWNTSTGSLRSTTPTSAQVSGLVWSQQHRELLSAHGNPSNELVLWSCDPAVYELKELTRLSGHEDRVLHLTSSAEKSMVVSAAADETLRFWKVWPDNKSRQSPHNKQFSLTSFIR